MSVGKLGSSWKTLRLGGGGVLGGFSLACRRSWGVVGGVMKLCRARGVSRPLACRGIQVSVRPSPGPGVGKSEVGRADTEIERGPWALLPILPSWELPGAQGRQAGERVSAAGPEPLSRRASTGLQPESSLCSPPVGQEGRHSGLELEGCTARGPGPRAAKHLAPGRTGPRWKASATVLYLVCKGLSCIFRPPFLADREATSVDITVSILQRGNEVQRGTGLSRAPAGRPVGSKPAKSAPKRAPSERQAVTDLLRVRKEKLGCVQG